MLGLSWFLILVVFFMVRDAVFLKSIPKFEKKNCGHDPISQALVHDNEAIHAHTLEIRLEQRLDTLATTNSDRTLLDLESSKKPHANAKNLYGAFSDEMNPRGADAIVLVLNEANHGKMNLNEALSYYANPHAASFSGTRFETEQKLSTRGLKDIFSCFSGRQPSRHRSPSPPRRMPTYRSPRAGPNPETNEERQRRMSDDMQDTIASVRGKYLGPDSAGSPSTRPSGSNIWGGAPSSSDVWSQPKSSSMSDDMQKTIASVREKYLGPDPAKSPSKGTRPSGSSNIWGGAPSSSDV